MPSSAKPEAGCAPRQETTLRVTSTSLRSGDSTESERGAPFPSSGVGRVAAGRRGARRRMVTAVVLVAMVCSGIAALSFDGSVTRAAHPTPSAAALARRDARRFLSAYVQPDGRVVRRDQGGDTVSEGQGYAMLVAVALRDHGTFSRVWRWDQQNLQLANGLFAYHWAGGRVVSHAPASDADLDTAWALVLAGRRFHDASYTTEGLRVAAAIMADETVVVDGRRQLVAGPWALGTPAIVNPSYLAPEAMDALGAAGAGAAWYTLATNSTALVTSIQSIDATRLVPDWVLVSAGGASTPSALGGASLPRYGLDAQRLPVWYAASCSAGQRFVARSMWPALRRAVGAGGRIAYSLEGRPLSQLSNPLGFVGAAAAAAAAGDVRSARNLLDRADDHNALYPTYYGSAWLALGRVLLGTTWLGGCPPM